MSLDTNSKNMNDKDLYLALEAFPALVADRRRYWHRHNPAAVRSSVAGALLA